MALVRRSRSAAPAPETEEAPTSPSTARRIRAVYIPAPPKPTAPVKRSTGETCESSRVDYDRVIAGYKEKAITPKKAIRAMCVECMGGLIAEVNRCTSTDCALYPFRMGQNPFHKLSKSREKEED